MPHWISIDVLTTKNAEIAPFRALPAAANSSIHRRQRRSRRRIDALSRNGLKWLTRQADAQYSLQDERSCVSRRAAVRVGADAMPKAYIIALIGGFTASAVSSAAPLSVETTMPPIGTVERA